MEKQRKVGKNHKQITELESVELFPPNDHCGYYGLVLKPNWMPKWLTWLLRNKLPIYYGWLNMPRAIKPYTNPTTERWWFIYPTGENRMDGNSVRVKPFLWCEIQHIELLK